MGARPWEKQRLSLPWATPFAGTSCNPAPTPDVFVGVKIKNWLHAGLTQHHCLQQQPYTLLSSSLLFKSRGFLPASILQPHTCTRGCFSHLHFQASAHSRHRNCMVQKVTSSQKSLAYLKCHFIEHHSSTSCKLSTLLFNSKTKILRRVTNTSYSTSQGFGLESLSSLSLQLRWTLVYLQTQELV